MGTALQSADPVFEKRLRSKLNQTLDQKKLFNAIDNDPALIGAGVVYVGSQGQKVELRPFEPLCYVNPFKVVLKEPSAGSRTSAVEHAADIRSRPQDSRLLMESLNTGLSCTAAVLGWVVVIGSTTSIPLTGGTSTPITILSYSAATASSIQCINGVVRTGNEIAYPQGNDWLDSQDWYQTAVFALDLISVGGAAGSGLMTVRRMKLLRSQGVSVQQALRGLGRPERKRLTTEIIRSNHPTASNAMIKAMQRAGKYPKRLTSEQVKKATLLQIKESVGATFSFAGSGTSGIVRNIAIGIYEVTE